ncbi:MAG: amidophosphoribosyltransferase, partial [Bacteroidales bacterium]|nr:amidophosphoribosyltransferase [Bacteroidales bacterium]
LCVHPNGEAEETPCLPAANEVRVCSFEHIYFSRATDAQIYRERKRLGELLAPCVEKAVGGDFGNTIFTPVPNTAQVAFLGLCDALSSRPRMEQLIWKDAERRAFITDENQRHGWGSRMYDVVYGQVREGRDTLVLVDDSIVRGTTLRENILRLIDRLNPKKIVVVSTAPQIRYPDCYGFDMAKLGELVAFEAAVSLLRESGREAVLTQIYEACRKELEKPVAEMRNCVCAVYEPFSAEEISSRVARLLRGDSVKTEVEVIYQTVENLHEACPENTGDWYFTGRYPTSGGNRTVCRAFVNYMENKNIRAY